MRNAAFISSPALWRRGFGGKHPLKPERLARTVALLEGYRAFEAPNVTRVESRMATEEELARFHTRDYIEAVRMLSESGASGARASRYGFGPGDNPVFKGMYETSALKTGSGIQGAEMLMDGTCDVAFNVSGGLHHAHPARASGFCIFNDVAVAIRWLVQRGVRVAYVDIDAHHGDGVQAAFNDTDRVLTLSLHQDGRTLFPGSGFVDETGRGAGEGYSVNVPLPPHTDDEAYLWAFRQVVPPLIHRFEPDILVSQLGVDTHYRDPLTHLALTTEGHEALVMELAALAPNRWLACGGGGYNLDVVPRSWTLAFGVMSEQTFPDVLPESYRGRYGGHWLRDRETPSLPEAAKARIWSHVKETVNALKARHNL